LSITTLSAPIPFHLISRLRRITKTNGRKDNHLKLDANPNYAEEMARDKSKFDSDVLINISRRLLSAVYELSQSYENYKSGRPGS
jgi:hypothetical protein